MSEELNDRMFGCCDNCGDLVPVDELHTVAERPSETSYCDDCIIDLNLTQEEP